MRHRGEYPRDPHNQLTVVTTADLSLESLDARLKALTSSVNNRPGIGPWLYPGKDVPLLGLASMTGPSCRFRRVGYDMVEFEGLLLLSYGGGGD